MATELLIWHDATTTKPDAGITVLCWGTEGFFTGWWDDEIESWIGCESGGSVLGVSHWADPDGPDGQDGLKDAGVAWKPKDILDRLAESSPNESSHELYCRCRDAQDEVERLRAALKQHDAWLSQAHVLCGDLGVFDGHIEDRLFEAIGKVRNAEENIFNPSTPAMDALLLDAKRYRWMVEMLQTAYDGNDLEVGDMIVGCRMTWARRDDRRCQAELIWHDKRDEPIGLSSAIDAAMAVSFNAQVQASGAGLCAASPGTES